MQGNSLVVCVEAGDALLQQPVDLRQLLSVRLAPCIQVGTFLWWRCFRVTGVHCPHAALTASWRTRKHETCHDKGSGPGPILGKPALRRKPVTATAICQCYQG